MTKERLKYILEIIELLLEYSNSAIIKNNFVKAFKNNTINNRLYGSYNLFGTKSCRLTSNDPNLLNLPSTGSVYAKAIKKCFKAEKDYIFCMIDYGALEDRIMANLSKDKNKCSIFLDGLDGHCLNSYYYFKDEIEKELPKHKDEKLKDYIKRYKHEVDNGNKTLKAIRQKSKSISFGLAYGSYPKKVAISIKCPIEQAEYIFNQYHNELYKDISKMRDTVLEKAIKYGYVHLGLGCYLNTDNPYEDIRTLNNSTCQFWDILSLLTINKINTLIKEHKLEDKINVISSIYDSIYFYVYENPFIIKWLNDNLIPIMTKDFLKNTIVKNAAELEIGYNWADTVAIPNNASIIAIKTAIKKAKDLVN